MRKLRTKIGAMIASAMLAVAMMAMPVSAAKTYGDGVSATEVSFNKYLVINEGDTVPNLTFEFEIEPIAHMIPADTTSSNKTVAVLPGPTTATKPSVGVAEFTSTDTSSTTVADGDNVTLATGKAYAKESVTIDFSGIKFNEPGVYRYILTEKVITGALGISYDTQRKDDTVGAAGQRVLDVYVSDVSDPTSQDIKLAISGYVLHESEAAPAMNATNGTGDVTTTAGALADKSDGFVNSLEAYDLVFSKTVSGNQASRDKYFSFTVSLSKVVPGTSYAVSYGSDGKDATLDGNADKTIPANPNSATTVIGNNAVNQPSTLTVEAGENSVAHTFYLQHGQSIVIHGLATGTEYTITENAEDYKPSVQVNAGVATDIDRVKGTVSADTSVSFTNTKEGVIPTGVILSVAPWVIAGVVIVGGIVFFAIRSKKKYEEE